MATSVIAILLFTFCAQGRATENAADSLSDRAVETSPREYADLDDTTLGKPGQYAVPASRVRATLPTSHVHAEERMRARRFHHHYKYQPVRTLFPEQKAARCKALKRAWSSGNVAKIEAAQTARNRRFAVEAVRTPTLSPVRDDMRNIAIIAHVDHGKTTLVDAMLQIDGQVASGADIGKDDRLMDSNDQEKERGITILAKNCAVNYKGTKINIVDTPGHADFGGEVERVLGMVDAVLLLVDAQEGPKPQTRFVLKKAIQMGHKILVVVNKIDKPAARPDYVLDKTFDLFCELGASDEQTDFPVVYASAINRIAGNEPFEEMKDMDVIFQKIMDLPKPPCDENGPLQLQISSVSSDEYIGRLGIGRITAGTLKKASVVGLSAGPGEEVKQVKVGELFNFDAMGRASITEAKAGEIVVFSGISDFNIGDTVVSLDDPRPLEPLEVEIPTMSMTFGVNKAPFAGKVGKLLTSRQIKDRLDKELETNVALKVGPTDDADKYAVSGRGLLHLTVLIETMRREGFEMMVGPPVVIEKEIDGERMEPYELVDIDVPDEYSGAVISLLNNRKGNMLDMGAPSDQGMVALQYEMPSRGMNGVKSALLSITRGLMIMTSTFKAYQPYAGDFAPRTSGNLYSVETGTVTAYSIAAAQARGQLFCSVGDEIYANQIIGISTRDADLGLNVCKTKALTNMRSAGADEVTKLTPPKVLTLEDAVEYIVDGEYVEVTPDAIRVGIHPKPKGGGQGKR